MLGLNTLHPNLMKIDEIDATILIFGRCCSFDVNAGIYVQGTPDGDRQIYHRLEEFRQHELIVDVEEIIDFDFARDFSEMVGSHGPLSFSEVVRLISESTRLGRLLAGFIKSPRNLFDYNENLQVQRIELDRFGKSDNGFLLMQDIELRKVAMQNAFAHYALERAGVPTVRTFNRTFQPEKRQVIRPIHAIVIKEMPLPKNLPPLELINLTKDGDYIRRIQRFRQWLTSVETSGLSADEVSVLIKDNIEDLKKELKREKIGIASASIKIAVSQTVGLVQDVISGDFASAIGRPFEIFKDIRDITNMERVIDKHEFGAFFEFIPD